MSVCADVPSYLRRWLLTAVFILATLLPGTSGCPKSCACYVPTEVHCTFRYLTAIPGQIQTAVERINLGYNSITVLRENDLSGLKHLELLMLHSNTIHSIADRAFQDLKSLQVLKMSYNRVKEINKDTFQGLEGLVRLHMDHNRIEFINPEAFYGLTTLQLVHLEGNLLQQLHPDTFITLRHSQVFKVSSVRNIHLSDNLLASLPKDVFTGCSQLENVYLHGNPWSCDCRMAWFPEWAERNSAVLKCKRDRKFARGQACPICETPAPSRGKSLTQLPRDAFTCTKPWIHPHLKQRNVSLDEGDYTPVSPRDFIAPIGSLQMNLTAQFHNDASLTCTVQRPSAMENLTLTQVEEGEKNVTMLSTTISTWLVCNIDYEHIQQLWRILATYSDVPMRLERGLMLSRTPDMIYKYSQIRPKEGHDEIHTDIEAEIKASPAWMMQGEVNFQLDRTTTTFSTLHIKYRSVVNLRVENKVSQRRDRYSWTIIKRDNQTQTEHSVLIGGVVELNCKTFGEPKPSVEWILSDGSKVRAPYSSEDRRIVITADGRLTLRGTDTSDTGLYRCIATNYLDADVLSFRVTVLSPDVEEEEVNGVKLSRPLGQSLVLDCGSAGNPEASIQWILPDHTVLDKSYGNRKLYRNGTLGIKDLTSRDRGFYRCLNANYLGVDLLTSQVTVTGEGSRKVTVVDREGSGVEALVEDSHSEVPSSSPSDRTIQESRTITSDRPYPRLRSSSQGRGSAGSWGRRRSPASSRRIWSNRRVFDQASRKVDLQRFAEFMKKAQGGSTTKTKKPDMSGDRDAGSGEGLSHEDGLIVLPSSVMPTTDSPDESMMGNNVMATTDKSETSVMRTMEIPNDSRTSFTVTTENTDRVTTVTTDSYTRSDATPIESTFTHSSHSTGSINETQGEAVFQYSPRISGSSGESYSLERNTTVPLRQLVTLLPAVTNTTDETQILFSRETPAEPDTSTGAALSLLTDPNVTPMMDNSQTTFTAVTTTEREQDEITFHTTQKIKSPRLPAGSTIISRQQIHIIPPMKGRGGGRGGGRRRNFPGRRRFIKPNRITDIQSILNKLKQPNIVKKQGSSTVPYTMELTTGKLCHVVEICTVVSYLSHEEEPKDDDDDEDSHDDDDDDDGDDSHDDDDDDDDGNDSHDDDDDDSHDDDDDDDSDDNHDDDDDDSDDNHDDDDSDDSHDADDDDSHDEDDDDSHDDGDDSHDDDDADDDGDDSHDDDDDVDEDDSHDDDDNEKKIGGQRVVTPTTSPKSLNVPSSSLGRTERPTTTYSTESPTTTTQPTSTHSQSPTTTQPTSTHSQSPTTTQPTSTHSQSPSTTQPTSSHSQSRGEVSSSYMTSTNAPESDPTHNPMTSTTDEPTTSTITTTIASKLVRGKIIWGKLFGNRDRQREIVNRLRKPARPSTTPEGSTIVQPTTPTTTTTNALPTQRSLAEPVTESPSRAGKHRETPEISSDDDYGDSLPDSEASTTPQPGTSRGTTTPAWHCRYSPTTESSPDTLTIASPPAPREDTDEASSSVSESGGSAGYLSRRFGGNRRPNGGSGGYLSRRFGGNRRPNGGTMTINGKMSKFEVFPNGTLSIQNANIKDRGQYLCLAENDQGSDKLLVTLSVVAYPSRILEPKVREIKSHSGKTVEMKCKVEGRPTPLVSWILANRTQVRGHNSDPRVSVTPEGTLLIKQVSVFDRGHYKCIASNPAGADTATVRLQVVAAPPGILEAKRQQVQTGVGQSLWLPCTAQGSPQPTVHWVLYDGTAVRPLKPSVDPRVSVSTNGTLHLTNTAATDSGKYECIVTSSTGSERRVVTLTVEKKKEMAPEIVEASHRRTELAYGDQLRLNCSATGDPKPRIIWRLPSKAVVDQWHRMGNRIQVLDNGTLVMDSVSDKDAGDYLCVARSKVGDDLQLMKVTVSMKPAKIEPKMYGKKQVPYGNDLKVDCKASGTPEPEISWGLPDGTMVNSALQSDSSSGGGRVRRYILFENGTLYLNQVGMAEEGDYTCYAENQLGKDEMHVHITVVTAAPRIRTPSRTYAQVKPGGKIRFDCEATGEPKPKILWMLPTNDMIAASNERYLMHINGSLDIQDVKLVDAGEYVCMARNTAGDDSKVYKIDIDGNPPVINGNSQNRIVVKDTATKYSRKFIDCKATGDPLPKITWIMPDNIFLNAPYFGSRINVHHNGTLEFRNVRPTDMAEFVCMARNDGGEAVMVVHLEVTDMLRRPIFKNPFNERVMTRMGKTTVMNCSAYGHPTPEIIWLLPNGTRFTGGSNRGSRQHLGIDGTFVIYNPSKEDAGKYRCAAKNSVGYIEKLIVLEVGQKPLILTRPRGIIRSVSGDPLFLHCLADGSPRPRIYWTIPGGHTLARPQVHGRHQLMENGTLVVKDTTLHDRGNYVCRASNDAGEAVLTVPVIIIAYPPRISTGPPPTVTAMAAAPIQLNCAAIGIPKPEITWELPDRSVLSTAGKGRPTGSELLHPQGTLIIQRPTTADSGTYKCLAKNHLGTDSRVTYVRVL
ncbi:unnamed protein product [Oncorhynchus mykiss]|uniref:Ig-like domain-containing protein n=1 Tax=Oncorhynchus mykiss TaxID=8022 RepID=A0A060YKD1_ONCMY|nr:unnamed protein product [Oncorhynchus mykiss]